MRITRQPFLRRANGGLHEANDVVMLSDGYALAVATSVLVAADGSPVPAVVPDVECRPGDALDGATDWLEGVGLPKEHVSANTSPRARVR